MRHAEILARQTQLCTNLLYPDFANSFFRSTNSIFARRLLPPPIEPPSLGKSINYGVSQN